MESMKNGCDVKLRRATLADLDFFLAVKSGAADIYWTGHAAPPDREDLREFFVTQLRSATRTVFVCEGDGEPVGYLYLDVTSDGTYESGYSILDQLRGRGLGSAMIGGLLNLPEIASGSRTVAAWILERNLASRSVVLGNGFTATAELRVVRVPLEEREETQRKYVWKQEDDDVCYNHR
jgi:RimJ/RimL family protein N-acetyltransferase